MKSKPLSSNCWLLAAALMLISITPGEAQRDGIGSKDKLMTVMNPAVTEKLAARVPLAPRLDTVEGRADEQRERCRPADGEPRVP